MELSHRHTALWTVGGVLILAAIGIGVVLTKNKPATTITTEIPTTSASAQTQQNESANETHVGLVIPGTWADPDIIQLPDGTFRLYLGEEPETAGASLDIFTATSTDGTTWTINETPVIRGGTFPDATRLSDGRIRLAYQSAGAIVSAISTNGLTFTKESGTRISTSLVEEKDNVRAPSTIQLPDGSLRIVYVGVQKGTNSSTAINQEIDTILSATSTDGLVYNDKTTVISGQGLPFDGFLDGVDLYPDDSGVLHLRFWTSAGRNNITDAGQYEMTSTDAGSTWSEPIHFYPSQSPLEPNGVLGGDPTYLIAGNKLYMYYTIRGEGVYLKTFAD